MDKDLHPLIEVADVEELAELQELEDETNKAPSASPLLSFGCVRGLLKSYEGIPSPMALLDASLSFIYRNDPFRTVVRSFEYPDHSSFLDTFKRCISPGQAAALCRAIKDPSHGYTWSDYLEHRAKYAGTMRTRVQILPFIPDDGDGSPLAWVVLFDDVTDENKRFLRTMFSSLLEASKLKDRDTGRHIERVNRYSHLLASAMYGDARWPEVDVDFVDNIGFLAAMHDVGKIGTPDDILNKQGPLNEFEWSIMKEHTINGAFILSSYPNPMAKQIAQSHHEWWNGTGYPYRLVGDMIPLPARIVALADVYDALRMRRSYKETFDHKRATLLITADGGTHFDPELVDLFKEMHEDFERIYNDIKDA